MFRRVLIANRGEIAVRIVRACRDLGISPVAVYSDADREALHVRMADRAVRLGPAPAAESYLRADLVLEAARATGAEAVHPGYGFLSENAQFAEACAAQGVVFVGPSSRAISAMGDKTAARATMEAAGVPVIPGSSQSPPDGEAALVEARRVGLPVMLKAAAGGGGKGMRLVTEEDQVIASFEAARREALASFGDGAVYVERALVRPRHVEVQVLADGRGAVLHVGERDCSIQRRHQKVVEETPCPALDESVRVAMGRAAVEAARAVDYVGAGTVEFLRDASGEFHFLEMNTRIQVEHPITEMVTGVDLVAWQLRIAAGEALTLTQDEIRPVGAAMECRVYAEDPDRGWMPSPGRIHSLRPPAGPGVRVDSGVYAGWDVPIHYDPMLSKLCTWGPDRDTALARMRRAVAEYRIDGHATNLRWLGRVLEHPDFVAGDYDTGFVERLPSPEVGSVEEGADDVVVAAMVLESLAGAGGATEGASSSEAAGRSAWRSSRATWRSGGLL